jgi:asparagine synthase (glutamine-hydrolysing)
LLRNLSLPPERAFAHSTSRLKFVDLPSLLRPEVRAALDGYDPALAVIEPFLRAGTADPVSRAQYADVRTWLPEDILVKTDRASMAVSLEVRAPLLDHVLLEFAASCPSSWWLRGRETKSLFREAIRPWVGDEVLARKKKGFSPPLRRWLLEDLRPRLEGELLAPDSRTGRYLDLASIRELWRTHAAGRRDFSDFFWALLVFETWHRTWMG